MADETLAWGLDVDTKGANAAFASFFGQLKQIFMQLNQVGQATGTATTTITRGMGDSAKEAARLKAEARAVATEMAGLGRQAEASFKGMVKEANALERALRQADMSPMAKKADTYAEKIKAGQAEVARLYLKLQDVKTTDEQRVKLAAKLADTQAQIARLQDLQAKASAAAAQDAQKQVKAEQDKAAAIAKTRQEREASAKAAEAERQAVAAARAAERSMAAGQRQQTRNATTLNRGVDRFDDSLGGQIGAIATTIRQAGMTEWQKLADDYGAAITRAHGKVSALKASLDQANVSEKDRLAIQHRIAEAEKNIGQLTAVSAKHVDQVRVAEEKRMQAVKASVAEVRQALQDAAMVAGTIGGAILAGFGGAGKKFAELSDQTSAFKATANATEAEVRTLVETAKGLEGIKTTAAAQAAVELTRAGLSAKEATANLGLFNNAAIATGESMDTVSKIILSTNRAFGLTNAELKDTGDILARTANVSATNIAEVGHAMSIMASTAKTTGQSLLGISTAFGILRDAGVSTEMAATGLKNALGDMNSPTDKQTEAMNRLFKTTNAVKKVFQENGDVRQWADILADIGKQLEGMSNVEKGQILKQIFPDERAFNIVQSYLAQTEEKIASNTKAMSVYGDEIDRAAGIMKESFGHQIRELQKDIEDMQLEIAESVLPTFQALVAGAKAATNAFGALPGPIKSTIANIALLAGGVLTAFAGAAGINLIVGRGKDAFILLGGTVKNVAGPALVRLGGIAGGLTAAAGPLTLLAGAAAAIYLAFQTNFAGVRDIFENLAAYVQDQWGAVWGYFVDETLTDIKYLQDGFEGFFHWLAEIGLTIFGTLNGILGGVLDMFLKLLAAGELWMRVKFFGGTKQDADNMRLALDEAVKSAQKLKSTLELPTMGDAFAAFREQARQALGLVKEVDIEAIKRERLRDNNRRAREAAAKKKSSGGSGGPGGDGDSDVAGELKRKMNAELAAAETAKTRRETALLNEEANQAEAKSLDELSAAIGRTAMAFANDRDQAVAFQKRMQSIGYTCAATVNEILRLAGVTQDLSKVIGNTNWVPNYDRLIDQGYAERIDDLSKLRAGDIVSGYERRGKRGHIGVAVGNGQVMHASGDAGKRSGLTQLAAIDSVQGAFGHIRKSHGGELYGIRFTERAYKDGLVSTQESGIKIEEDYHRQRMAILAKYEGAYKQAMSRMASGSKEFVAANTDLLDIQKQIAEEEKALAKLGVDVSELRKKAHEDYLKAVQKDIQAVVDETQKAFDTIKSSAESMLSSLTEKVESLRESNFKATLSPDQQRDFDNSKDIQGFLDQSGLLQAKMEQIQADMTEIGKRGALMTPEQRKQLETLRTEYGMLKVALEDIKGAIPELAVEQMTQGILEDLKGENEFVDGLKASREAMHKFLVEAQKGGEVTDSLRDRVQKWAETNNMSSAGAMELVGAMEEYIQSSQRATEAQEMLGNRSKETGDDFELNQKKTKEWAKGFATSVDQVASAVGAVGSVISQLAGEAGAAFGEIVDGIAGMGQGLAQVASGNFAGAIQLIGSFLDMTMKLLNRNKQAAIDYRRELERLGLSMAQGETGRIRRELSEAEASGATEEKKTGLKKSLAQASFREGVQQVMSDYHSQKGMDFRVDMKDGIPDFQERVDRYQKLYDEAMARGDQAQAREHLKHLNDFKQFNERILDLQSNLKIDLMDGTKAAVDEVTNTVTESVDALSQYLANRSNAQSRSNAVESMMDKLVGGDREVRDAIRSTVEGLVDERDRITDEVMAAYKGDAFAGSAELASRMAQFSKDMQEKLGKAILDAQGKVLQQALANAETAFKENAEALKEARREVFEQDSRGVQRLIDQEQRRLDRIEKQNARLQEQIQLRQELLEKDLAAFEKKDLGSFAKLVAGVDFQGELRKGLEDIHNPEGVETGTYSGQSHQEAMKERLELLRLQNENKFGLEQYNSKDADKNKAAFLAERMRIDAIEARFADEELKRTDLTNRQRLELEAQKNSAYNDYKAAFIESLNDAADKEIEATERTITANNKKADVIRSNMEEHQKDLAKLSESFNKDLVTIDESAKRLLETHDSWKPTLEAVRKGIKGPLSEIREMYLRVANAARSALQAGATLPNVQVAAVNVAAVGEANAYAQSLASSMLSKGGLPRMATGGVVPPGFSGDKFPALLNSGEPVFPAWFANLLESSYRMNVGGGIVNSHNSSRGDVHVHVHGGDLEAVKREFRKALNESEYGGARINGANYLN